VPYLSGLLGSQSDFGQPAGDVFGVVLATESFRNFPQNLACGADRSFCSEVRRCASCVFIWHRTD
jgi:hypothetical protein